MSSPLDKIVGKVITKEGKCDLKVADLDFIGLYFSAHWCPPCRGFTPKLAEYYTKRKAEGKKFEVVFVSHDRDEASFKEYFDTMPWLAVDFSENDLRTELAKTFGISGIPALIVLNRDGTVCTKDGREVVGRDVFFDGVKK